MKQYQYEQMGENIPVYLEGEEREEDPQGRLINPIKPKLPTVGNQYVACIYDDLKIVDCLIEIEWHEVDELIKNANARRQSII